MEKIKIGNYIILTDDSDIQKGDWVLANIPELDIYGPIICNDSTKSSNQFKKIIGHIPLNDVKPLNGIDIFPEY